MTTEHQPHKPIPFLNWKRFRRWSAGYRAPNLCKLFMKAKSSSISCQLSAMGKILRQASSSSSSSSSPSSSVRAKSPPPPLAAPCTINFSTKESISMQRSISYSNSNNNSVVVGAIAIANCLRRHSDAIAPQGPRVNPSLNRRFSVDSAQPYYTTEYLKNEELNDTRPNLTRLGAYQKPDNFSMGSPMVAKMKDTYARFVHTVAQPNSARHPLDLLVGNPFLTRVNPAPVSSMLMVDNARLNVAPSSGFLSASIKSRDLELKDRIVFFL